MRGWFRGREETGCIFPTQIKTSQVHLLLYLFSLSLSRSQLKSFLCYLQRVVFILDTSQKDCSLRTGESFSKAIFLCATTFLFHSDPFPFPLSLSLSLSLPLSLSLSCRPWHCARRWEDSIFHVSRGLLHDHNLKVNIGIYLAGVGVWKSCLEVSSADGELCSQHSVPLFI